MRPGRHLLTAEEFGSTGGAKTSARVAVDVSDRNVEGVVLAPVAFPELKGRVAIEAPSKRSVENFSSRKGVALVVNLIPRESADLGALPRGPVNESGEFKVTVGSAQVFDVELVSLAPDLFLKTIRIGTADITGNSVDLSQGVAGEAAAVGFVKNLNTRIKAWWWIVLILAGAVLAGRMAVIGLFAVISFIALREFLALTAVQAADRRVVIGCFLIVLPAQYALVAIGRYDLFAGCIPFLGLVIVPVLTALTGHPRNYLARTAELLWGLSICVNCISHIPALRMVPIPGDRGILLTLFLILVAQTSDVMQYV